MKIAVMQYQTGNIDVIDLSVNTLLETFKQCVENGEWDDTDDWREIIECYLANWCKYDLSQCDWMAENRDGSGSPISVSYLSHDDFNAFEPPMNRGIWDDSIAKSHYRNRGNDTTKPIHDDLLIISKEMFGDDCEHSVSFDFYDGYAIGSYGSEPLVLIYPTLCDIRHLPEVERGIRDYTGFETEELNFFDSGLKYGILYKPEQLENTSDYGNVEK